MKWPAIPKRLTAPGGEISVRIVAQPSNDAGAVAWGTWEESIRVIEIQKNVPVGFQWRVLFHEWGHAVIDDSGLKHLLTDESQETLCDAFATARWVEMQARWRKRA